MSRFNSRAILPNSEGKETHRQGQPGAADSASISGRLEDVVKIYSYLYMGFLGAALILGTAGTVGADVTQYNYLAETVAPAANMRGAVKAGSLTWQCKGNQCRISGPWPTPGVSACRSLAQKVGPIAKYGHAGKWLTEEQLATCNEGIQEALPSPGVIQAQQGQVTKAAPSTGVIQAQQGQVNDDLPSPGVVQAPVGETNETMPSTAAGRVLGASEAVRTGTTVLLGTYQWDVDSDQLEVTNAADLWLNHIDEDSFQLTPLNGANIALLGRYSCGDITPEQMAQGRYRTTPLIERSAYPLIGEGSVIGIVTNSRKLAKLCVRGYRSSHDFGFPEASLLTKKWKSMVRQQAPVQRYHMILTWTIYDQIDPFSLFEAPE